MRLCFNKSNFHHQVNLKFTFFMSSISNAITKNFNVFMIYLKWLNILGWPGAKISQLNWNILKKRLIIKNFPRLHIKRLGDNKPKIITSYRK